MRLLGRRHALRLVLLSVSALACITYLLTGRIERGPVSLEQELHEFWKDLAFELHRNEPVCDEVNLPPEKLERAVFDPANEEHQVDLQRLDLNETQSTQLRAGHRGFVAAARRLAPRLPFDAGTKGIVMTANMGYLGVAMTSLMVLRRRGSVLPAQIFIDGADEDALAACNRVVAELNTRCINMDVFLDLSNLQPRWRPTKVDTTESENEPEPEPENFKLDKYQFKVFALLFSSFQELLFLDADVIPVQNPDFLLDVTAEPYGSHGLVTWPDSWLPTVADDFYDVVGIAKPEVTDDSRCNEAGILLYDKARHADSLLLAAYYNFYGPRHYYPLLSQGAWGQGDKETFLKAAQVLGKPAWLVHKNLEFLSQDEFSDGTGMMQFDPVDDYRVWSAQQDIRARESQGEQVTDAEKERLVGPKPRWLFAHLNRVKIDARRVAQSVGGIIFEKKDWALKVPEGQEEPASPSSPSEEAVAADIWEIRPDGPNKRYQRAWGPNNATLTRLAGYDVEKALWDEVIPRLGCEWTISEECEKLTVWYRDVFAGLP